MVNVLFCGNDKFIYKIEKMLAFVRNKRYTSECYVVKIEMEDFEMSKISKNLATAERERESGQNYKLEDPRRCNEVVAS